MNELFERLVALQDEHSENIELYGLAYMKTGLCASTRLSIARLKMQIELLDVLYKALNR